ncbi:arylsulfotransferase family protein [Vibrio breoganii]
MDFEQVRKILSASILAFILGVITTDMHLYFPYETFQKVKSGFREIKSRVSGDLPWYLHRTDRTTTVDVFNRDVIQPGLSLVTGLGPGNHSQASVIDVDGNVIHNWQIDWFELWPNAEHVHDHLKSITIPNTHGVKLMSNGDLIFSLEYAGLFRVDLCGNVIWRFPRMTHHSVFLDDAGYLWTLGLDYSESISENLPGYAPGYYDFKIFKMSTDGELIQEWRLFELLKDNNLESLLYMSSIKPGAPVLTDDTLHPNDIEIFPSTMKPGFFESGDIMVSMRNIHTVAVFDSSMKIKKVFTGSFIRQHDPDFIDGNTISVFDNYTHTYTLDVPYSRILYLTSDSDVPFIRYSGTDQQPFYTHVMGKHEHLDNGNLLITEASQGRAFELKDNDIVWQFHNVLPEGLIGFIDEVQRLGPEFDEAFFRHNVQKCSTNN